MTTYLYYQSSEEKAISGGVETIITLKDKVYPLPEQTSEAFVPEKRGAAERASFGRKAEARDVQLVTSYSTMAKISF